MTIEGIELLIGRCQIKLISPIEGQPFLKYKAQTAEDMDIVHRNYNELITFMEYQRDGGNDVLISTTNEASEVSEDVDPVASLRALEQLHALYNQKEKLVKPLVAQIEALEAAHPRAAAMFHADRLVSVPDVILNGVGGLASARLGEGTDPSTVLEDLRAMLVAYLISGGWQAFRDPVNLTQLTADPVRVQEHLDILRELQNRWNETNN